MKHQTEEVEPVSSGFNAQLQRHFLQVIWQRKAVVVFGIIVGSILGGLYFAQSTPVYQSGAQVLVVKKRAGDEVPTASGNQRVSITEDYVSTHLVLLKSQLVAERAVKKRELQKLPSLAGVGDPVGVIVSSLGIAREKEAGSTGSSNIINMSYRGPSAEDCGIILQALIESYQAYLDEIYRNFSDETLELITRGREVLKRDLSDKEKAYREFRETSPLIWKGREGLTVQQERVTLIEAQRSKLLIQGADLRDRLKTFELAIVARRSRAELLALANSRAEDKEKSTAPTVDPVEAQLLPLLLQEQQLLEMHGSQHPEVVSIRNRVSFLREMVKKNPISPEKLDVLEDPIERCLQRLRNDTYNVENRYQALTTVLESEQKEARRFDVYAMQDENFRNEIMRSQQLYESIIKRLQEINLVRDVGGFDARPISRPGPGRKVAPNMMLMLLGGATLGFLFGVGLAYVFEFSDKGFHTAEEIRHRLGLPVIGHIPLLVADPEAQQRVKLGEPTLDPFLCTSFRPKSVEAEAYRAVRTALYFSTLGGGHKVIQVTSPDMGDGKSTLVTNLAVCIAQSGKRTIIIDADLRRPRMHRMFGLTASKGLAGVISGETRLRDAVQATSIPNLFILPCGPLPPNPAELLTSPRFKEVLEAVRAKFDFVLVDTPPLLAVTDPCVVAPRVDGVVLTLRLSKKSGPKAERARELLSSLGVKVLGVVVNGVMSKSGSARFGGGQYEYGYGQNDYSARTEESGDAYYEEPANEIVPAKGIVPSSDPTRSSKPAAPRAKTPSIRGSGALGWLLSLWM